MAAVELVEICRDDKNKAVVNLHGEKAEQSVCGAKNYDSYWQEQLSSLGSMMEWT